MVTFTTLSRYIYIDYFLVAEINSVCGLDLRCAIRSEGALVVVQTDRLPADLIADRLFERTDKVCQRSLIHFGLGEAVLKGSAFDVTSENAAV